MSQSSIKPVLIPHFLSFDNSDRYKDKTSKSAVSKNAHMPIYIFAAHVFPCTAEWFLNEISDTFLSLVGNDLIALWEKVNFEVDEIFKKRCDVTCSELKFILFTKIRTKFALFTKIDTKFVLYFIMVKHIFVRKWNFEHFVYGRWSHY